MIKSVTVINPKGEAMTLTLTKPNESGFIITSIDGLGPASASINTVELATQDGSIFNSSRVQQRNIVLNLMFLDSTLDISYLDDNGYIKSRKSLIEDIRLLSYRYFPIKKEVTLIFQTDNRFVSTKGYIESNEPKIFSSKEETVISVICPDPYFYVFEPTIIADVPGDGSSKLLSYSTIDKGVIYFKVEVDPSTFRTVTASRDGLVITKFSTILDEFDFGSDGNTSLDGFPVPSSAPLSGDYFEFESINQEHSGMITYLGDKEVGVEISIDLTGSAENISIFNLTTEETMVINTDMIEIITGYGLMDGDQIVLNTISGEKSAVLKRAGTTYNILSALGRDCDWMHLTQGDNEIGYSADSGVDNLYIEIGNKTAYEGI